MCRGLEAHCCWTNVCLTASLLLEKGRMYFGGQSAIAFHNLLILKYEKVLHGSYIIHDLVNVVHCRDRYYAVITFLVLLKGECSQHQILLSLTLHFKFGLRLFWYCFVLFVEFLVVFSSYICVLPSSHTWKSRNSKLNLT